MSRLNTTINTHERSEGLTFSGYRNQRYNSSIKNSEHTGRITKDTSDP